MSVEKPERDQRMNVNDRETEQVGPSQFNEHSASATESSTSNSRALLSAAQPDKQRSQNSRAVFHEAMTVTTRPRSTALRCK
jgi:hypothetical protein